MPFYWKMNALGVKLFQFSINLGSKLLLQKSALIFGLIRDEMNTFLASVRHTTLHHYADWKLSWLHHDTLRIDIARSAMAVEPHTVLLAINRQSDVY